MRSLLLLSLGLTLPLRADALSDLRAALQRSQSQDAVSLKVDYQFWTRGLEKGATAQQGRVMTRMENGPQGLKLQWTPEVVAQARADQKAKAKGGVGEAMRAIDAAQAAHITEAAEEMLSDLEGATLKGERAETWKGQPARRLELDLQVHLDKEELDHIKKATSTAVIWVAEDGSPLAMEYRQSLKGSFFLISFEMSESSHCEYQRRGQRLLLIKEEKENRGSGMGKGQEGKTTLTVTLL